MSILFPTSLDSFPNPVGTDLLENAVAALDHDVQHSNVNDAIEALEAKVGIDGSAVNTSHDYKLSAVTGGAKALTSGTSTQSVTNLTLVTPTITLNSDATGDMYYRNSGGAFTRLPIGTTGQILDVSSGGIPEWTANPAAADASTTVKGVVEQATSAEINAGTSTGDTGAILFVSPDQLLLSNYLTTSSVANKLGNTFIATESITAGMPVSSCSYQSDGGITLDAKTTHNSSVTSAGGTDTISFTVGNNTNRALICYVNVGALSGTVPTPTVTFNGSPMTAVDTEATSSSNKLFSFILTSPTVGTNNLVVTLGASAQTNYTSTAILSYYNTTGIASYFGATASPTVSYTTPALGTVLISGASQNTGTSSANNYTNYQTSGTNSFSCISTADSGVVGITGNATVTYSSAGGAITVIGLTPVTSPAYGYVCKSSASTAVNAVNLNKYTLFTGFANATVSAGQSLSVVTNGVVTGLTSLTPLLTYYLADTAGTISSTAGTNSKKIGFASSATVLVLKDSI